MTQPPGETLDDRLARQNIEGRRTSWQKKRRKIDRIFRRVGPRLRRCKTALEIGLGEGYTLRKLAEMGLAVTGVDISGYLVEYLRDRFAAERIEATLLQADASTVRLMAGQFDVAFCLDVLEHIPGEGMTQAVAAVHEALVKGGLFVATLPLGEKLEENMVVCPRCGHEFHRIGHHHSFQTLDDIREVFADGFDIVSIREVPFAPFAWAWANAAAWPIYRLACRLLSRRVSSTVCIVATKKRTASGAT